MIQRVFLNPYATKSQGIQRQKNVAFGVSKDLKVSSDIEKALKDLAMGTTRCIKSAVLTPNSVMNPRQLLKPFLANAYMTIAKTLRENPDINPKTLANALEKAAEELK